MDINRTNGEGVGKGKAGVGVGGYAEEHKVFRVRPVNCMWRVRSVNTSLGEIKI